MESFFKSRVPTIAPALLNITSFLGNEAGIFLLSLFKTLLVANEEDWKLIVSEFILARNKKLFITNYLITLLSMIDEENVDIRSPNNQLNRSIIIREARKEKVYTIIDNIRRLLIYYDLVTESPESQ